MKADVLSDALGKIAWLWSQKRPFFKPLPRPTYAVWTSRGVSILRRDVAHDRTWRLRPPSFFTPSPVHFFQGVPILADKQMHVDVPFRFDPRAMTPFFSNPVRDSKFYGSDEELGRSAPIYHKGRPFQVNPLMPPYEPLDGYAYRCQFQFPPKKEKD